MNKRALKLFLAPALLALSTFSSQFSSCLAQGTAFTYQGRLNNNNSPAAGSYNLTFTLFNNSSGGVAIAAPVTNNAVNVTNGLFTVPIDFGSGVFTGTTNWLQIGVATNGVNSFTTLTPRQQLTPAPYAIYAENVSAAGISGTIQPANLGGSLWQHSHIEQRGQQFQRQRRWIDGRQCGDLEWPELIEFLADRRQCRDQSGEREFSGHD